MPDFLLEAWLTPGLGWLALTVLVAGIVRGFAGFGTGLIVVPLAAMFIPPVWALIAIMAIELVGTLPLVPKLVRHSVPRDVVLLGTGCAVTLPFGTYVLQVVDPEVFRWIVSLLSLGFVAVLLSGWRHHVTLGRRALLGIGGVGGFLGGFTGIPGPPVILAYMSGQYPPTRIRANTMLFLLVFEVLFTATFIARGMMELHAFAIGLLLIPPYMAGNLMGARLFNPLNAKLYRAVAYGIIAASALVALPVFR